MRVLFSFSGEHARLPEAELEGVLDGERLRWRLLGRDRRRRLLLAEVHSRRRDFACRLALTQKAVEVASVAGSLREVADKVYPKLAGAESFCVRCESNTVERELGAILHERGLRVDLRRPEKTVFAFRFGRKFVAGFDIPLSRDFASRHPLKRPFFHPTSMKPKTARVLVNLAGVRRGSRLLDPFCGAGGVLIEAGLMGLECFGWDIDSAMLDGCRRNTVRFGVKAKLEKADALEKKALMVDAVVTDPPYGKSSSTVGLKREELYDRFAGNIIRSIKRGGALVMVLPGEHRLRHPGFVLREKHRIRVHKSLTRVTWVLEKA